MSNRRSCFKCTTEDQRTRNEQGTGIFREEQCYPCAGTGWLGEERVDWLLNVYWPSKSEGIRTANRYQISKLQKLKEDWQREREQPIAIVRTGLKGDALDQLAKMESGVRFNTPRYIDFLRRSIPYLPE